MQSAHALVHRGAAVEKKKKTTEKVHHMASHLGQMNGGHSDHKLAKWGGATADFLPEGERRLF